MAALYSGGKDSTLAIGVALQRGWDVTRLVSILPADPASMLYHVPNLHVVPLLAEAMTIPLAQAHAEPTEAGELAALRDALRPLDVDGVLVGAIESDYQHSRVNRVAHALGLRVFAPLWRLNPRLLVHEYARAGFRIVFSSVSAEGLDGSWLGRAWDASAVRDLLRLEGARGVHPCGEGGEFETLVLDAPFFRKRLEVERAVPQWTGSSGVWRIERARLVDRAA
jgi:ABC transporter with metal-binding/Fe-S-binding domain ATP-binding protein